MALKSSWNNKAVNTKNMEKNLLVIKKIYTFAKTAIWIIMNCRAPEAIKLRTRLGFNQHDLIMTKVQPVLTKIVKVFSSEIISLQHFV